MATSPFVSLFGIVEIGMALGMFLSGMIMLQVWLYFRNYSSDRLGLRCLVGLIQVVDILHSVVLIHTVYTYTIFYFGDPEGAATVIWSFKATAMILGINIAIVHSFFLMRVYTLTKSIVLFLISGLLAATRLVIHIRQMVTIFTATDLAFLRGATFRWEVTSLLTVGAASDVLVAASICWALLRMRSGMPSSNKLIDRLIAFTVGSGLLTSIVAVLEAVLYLSFRGWVFALFFGILGKLFSVSLLASLNERQNNRRKLDGTSIDGALSVSIEMQRAQFPSDEDGNSSLCIDEPHDKAPEV